MTRCDEIRPLFLKWRSPPARSYPERPPNSPRNVYQIESSTLALLQTFETAAWRSDLAGYLQSMKGINRLRDKARQMSHIPVTLPNGQSLELTAGGQNVLVKEIVEQFAPRFTPRGHVIYIGDAGEKHLFYDVEVSRRPGCRDRPTRQDSGCGDPPRRTQLAHPH